MPKTVIQHVLGRLKDIGIDDIFGVAGDFAFPIQDAIVGDPRLNWLGCCNELNAAYAADGYARLRGVGALSTTYGVGELSAISGIGGSYAENVPVFHLTGMPTTAAPHNAVYETERLIAEALYHRRPVYMAIPADVADQEVLGSAQPLDLPRSNQDNVRAATEAILSALDSADAACILPGWLVRRVGLQSQLQAFVDASGMPFATMFGD